MCGNACVLDCVLIEWCGMIDTCTDLSGVLDCFVNSDVCMHTQRDVCTFMTYHADVLDYVVTHWCVQICPDRYSRCHVWIYWCTAWLHTSDVACMPREMLVLSCLTMLMCSIVSRHTDMWKHYQRYSHCHVWLYWCTVWLNTDVCKP